MEKDDRLCNKRETKEEGTVMVDDKREIARAKGVRGHGIEMLDKDTRGVRGGGGGRGEGRGRGRGGG